VTEDRGDYESNPKQDKESQEKKLINHHKKHTQTASKHTHSL